MNEKVDLVSWSLCGDQTAILNVNSEIRISPQTSRDKGLMTVSSSHASIQELCTAVRQSINLYLQQSLILPDWPC